MVTENSPVNEDKITFSFEHLWNVVPVQVPGNSYEILIGPGILTELAGDLRTLNLSDHYIIVTDSNVLDLLGEDLLSLLRSGGLHADMIFFKAGEESKHMGTVVDLARRMVGLGADRNTAILALGGGVVGDVAAFLASIYMRGIPFVQLPTTLLAQVDSSVGGKTGVDLPEGKNLLGTFAQPRRVYADIGVLSTLPAAEIRNGLAEVVKYGMIRSPELFRLLEDRWWDVANLEPEITAEIVARSCQIKADVVAVDEKEGGLRRILNFGHTIGHAIEAAANFQIPHGEAVAMGMVAISRISRQKGLISEAEVQRLENLLEKFGLPTRILQHLSAEELIDLMAHDKKKSAGKVHFVLCKGIGDTVITDEVSTEELKEAIK